MNKYPLVAVGLASTLALTGCTEHTDESHPPVATETVDATPTYYQGLMESQIGTPDSEHEREREQRFLRSIGKIVDAYLTQENTIQPKPEQYTGGFQHATLLGAVAADGKYKPIGDNDRYNCSLEKGSTVRHLDATIPHDETQTLGLVVQATSTLAEPCEPNQVIIFDTEHPDTVTE